MDIVAAMKEIVGRLEAGGVRATLDGTDAHPPCVLLRAPTMTYRFGKGSWNADWEAWAMVPATGITNSLTAIGDLLEATQTALGHAGVTATPDDARLTDGSTVPMYRLTWSDRIPA